MSAPAVLAMAGSGLGPGAWVAADCALAVAEDEVALLAAGGVGPVGVGWSADLGALRVASLEHPAAASTAARVAIAVRRSTEPPDDGSSKFASSGMAAL